MRVLSTALLFITLLATSFTGVVTAKENENPQSLNFKTSAGVTYRDLKVGHSMLLGGASSQIVYGSQYVSLTSFGLLTGVSIGDAQVDVYDINGNLTTYIVHVIS